MICIPSKGYWPYPAVGSAIAQLPSIAEKGLHGIYSAKQRVILMLSVIWKTKPARIKKRTKPSVWQDGLSWCRELFFF